MNADNIKFRCSSLGSIMTEAKDKSKGLLGETCKKHLVEVFINEKYGREKDITTNAMLKGLMVEEDAITLYSRLRKTNFRKNKETLENDFIKGTPDLFDGDFIEAAKSIIDIKSSYDIFTFFNNTAKSVNAIYYWQMQGYMALTGATQARLVYCLINTPDSLINDEKRRLQWKMNVIDDANSDFQEASEKLNRNMIYDDIPIQERVLETIIDRDEEAIERIYERVQKCRDYMNQCLFNTPLIILK